MHRLLPVGVDATQVAAEVAGRDEVEDVVGHHQQCAGEQGVDDGVAEGVEEVEQHGGPWREEGCEGGRRQPEMPRLVPPKPPDLVVGTSPSSHR